MTRSDITSSCPTDVVGPDRHVHSIRAGRNLLSVHPSCRKMSHLHKESNEKTNNWYVEPSDVYKIH